MKLGKVCRLGLVGVVAAACAMTAGAESAQAVAPTKPAQTWGLNGRVSAILPLPSGKVVVGGSFSAVVDSAGATTFPVTNVALFDPATGVFDSGWRPSVNNSVNALATDGQRVFLGGAFSKVGGVNRDKLAAVTLTTGALDSSWVGPGLDGPVDVMRLSADALFLGGNWDTVTSGGVSYTQAKVAKVSSSTGAFDTAFRPVANPTPSDQPPSGRVWALLALDNGNVVVGGDFGDINGVPSTRRIAIVNPTTGTPVPGFASKPNNGSSTATILDLATDGTRIFEAVAGAGGACTAVDASTGNVLWSVRANGNMQSVRAVGNTLYCGGHYGGSASFGGQTRNKVAAVDAGTGAIQSWAPVVNSALGVWAMGSDATRMYLGGDFTKAGGVDQQHFAMWVDPSAASVPTAPTLAATAGDAVVHLAWQPPSSDGGSPIQRYKVWRKAAGSASYPNAALATVSSGTGLDDTTVANGTAYTYKVVAINGVGSGPASNDVTVTPSSIVQTPPSAPQSLTAAAGGANVSLAWQPPTSPGNPPFSSYQIYRGTASGQETLLASVSSGTTSFADALPPTGTTYYYTVRAVSAASSSPDSNEASAGNPATSVPAQPTLTATASAGKVSLSWTPGSGGGPVEKWVILRDNIQLTRVTTPATTTYDDTTVTSGATYSYKVRAVNSVGGSPNSNAVSVTVP